ncbi:MAG: TSUP family transporter, partial [Actinomycetota bacterium]|nr:TSUP family transporter [Actinomycetota bacterium]
MSEVEGLLLVLAGVVAGAASAMAGGASLLTFPVLLSFGLPPLTANVTNTVGLVPTSIGAALASRDEMRGQWRLLFLLMIPAALGSVLGSALLLLAPAQVFSAVVPGLLALSSVLLLAQPWLLARLR